MLICVKVTDMRYSRQNEKPNQQNGKCSALWTIDDRGEQ